MRKRDGAAVGWRRYAGSAVPGAAGFPRSSSSAVGQPGRSGPGLPGSGGAPVPGWLLTGVQFVSPTRGWVVGQDTILATTDGGRHWAVQDSGPLDLTSVDFVSSQAGWAVGTHSVLATVDGGARWAPLPEPCPPIRSVHFVSPDVGFAVGGGRNVSDAGLEAPEVAGVVLATSDGGRSWRALPAPAGAQTVCFSGPRDGWLGAGGRLYRTTDGGHTWAQATAGVTPVSARYPYTMIVQCAGTSSAWAPDIGPGAAMSQQPHAGYHAGPAGVVPVFAEQYFPHPGARVRAPSPGSYAGPFSAISPAATAFIDCHA